MICRHCHTEFDTSAVRPGESVRCPGCGKMYLRKVAPDQQDQSRPASSGGCAPRRYPAPKPRKRSFGALLAVLVIMVILSLAGIGLIGLYQFAPETFHKVTFGWFAPEEEPAAAQEAYVLTSYRSVLFDENGSQKSSWLESCAYTNEGLLSAVYTDRYTITLEYDCDSKGYPVTVKVYQDGFELWTIPVTTEKEGGVLKVRLNGTDYAYWHSVIREETFRGFFLFRNADVSDNHLLLRYREGKEVLRQFSYLSGETWSEETKIAEDGSKIVKITDTASHTSIKTREYDAKGRLVKYAVQLDDEKGALEIQYFRERNDDGTYTDHGVVVKVRGELLGEEYLGRLMADYVYDRKGALVTETEYRQNGTGLPDIQRYYQNGHVIREVSTEADDDGHVSSLVTKEYAPLSKAQSVDVGARPAANGIGTDTPCMPEPVTSEPAQAPTVTDQPGEGNEGNVTTPMPVVTPTFTPLPPTFSPTPTTTPTPKPTATPKPRVATILHCNNAANVRSEPNSGSSKLGTVSWGKTVTVLGEVGDWTMIEFKGGVGYVFSEYVAIHHMGTIVDVKNRVTVRIAPDEDSTRLGAINLGKSVEVIEIDGDWAMIVYKDSTNGIAYIHSKFVRLDD